MKTKFLALLVTLLFLSACGEVILTPTDEASTQPAKIATNTVTVPPTEDSKPETVLLSDCTVVSSLPEPSTEFVELFSVNENDWAVGPENAAVTLIEYGDFQ
jgi:hypothetical protein